MALASLLGQSWVLVCTRLCNHLQKITLVFEIPFPEDVESSVRKAAVLALRRLQQEDVEDCKVTEALRYNLLHDPNADVRATAAKSLGIFQFFSFF